MVSSWWSFPSHFLFLMYFWAPARIRTKTEALQLWRNFCLGTQTWEISWENMLWNCWTGLVNLKDEGSLDKSSHWWLFVQFGYKLLNPIGLNNVCAYIHSTGNESVKQNGWNWGPNITGLVSFFFVIYIIFLCQIYIRWAPKPFASSEIPLP